MTVYNTVWSLWPTIAEMARDLKESPGHLIEQRNGGFLPDERHDDDLLAKSMYNGKRLSITAIRAARSRPPDDRLKRGREKRTKAIAKFYDRAGGVKALAERTGATENILHLAKARAYLPRRWKYEFKEVDPAVPDYLFTPMP